MTFSDSGNFSANTSLNVISPSFLLSSWRILNAYILDLLILLSKSCYLSLIFWIVILGSDFQFTNSFFQLCLIFWIWVLNFDLFFFFFISRSSIADLSRQFRRLLFLAYMFRLFLEIKVLKLSKPLPWSLGLHQQEKRNLRRNMYFRNEYFFPSLHTNIVRHEEEDLGLCVLLRTDYFPHCTHTHSLTITIDFETIIISLCLHPCFCQSYKKPSTLRSFLIPRDNPHMCQRTMRFLC